MWLAGMASPSSSSTAPTDGMRITSSLRPRASRIAPSESAISSSTSMVRIVAVGGRLADDAARRDEAREIVDVAIGVIVQQAFIEPQHFLDAKRALQRNFRALFGPVRDCGSG